jgi:colanic acid/amylovoran biosynthesis glycosyltransferase
MLALALALTSHSAYALFSHDQKYSYRYERRHKISLETIKGSKRPRLLFVESYFPPVTSSAALNQLTSLLDSKKFDITIYAKNDGTSEWTNPDIAKYNLHKYQNVFIGRLPRDLRIFDIILCQFGYRGSEFIKLKNKYNLKAKIVTCFRGCDLTQHIQKNPQKYDVLIQEGDYFLPVCDYFQQKLVDLGCAPEKITVLPSTIDSNKFQFHPLALDSDATKPIQITTVSRLIEKKGLEYAIQAIAQLVTTHPNIHYSLVGFGPLKEDLEKLIKTLGIENNVTLEGRFNETQIIELLKKTHIFVLPSVTAENNDQEGIPNALKEAMACGKPVISTYHAGIPELVEDGVSGFLVPEKDAPALAQKIEYLLQNPNLWHDMGVAGRKKIKTAYEKKQINKKLVNILLSLHGKGATNAY